MEDAQLGNYTIPADNKGILSLLTAIEQSEDHEHPDNSPSKLADKEPLSVSTDNFSNLNLETLSGELNLANLSLCLICGRNFNVESTNNGMIDINTLIDIPGEESRSIQSVVEEIIPIMRSDPTGCAEPDQDSGYVCVDCFLLVDGILKLRAQIQEYVSSLQTKYLDWLAKKKSSKLPELLEFRIPISILNVRDEDNTQPSAALPELTAAQEMSACADPGIAAVSNPKKSKLQILAETLEDERRSPSSVIETDDFQLTSERLEENSNDISPGSGSAPGSGPGGDIRRQLKNTMIPVSFTKSIDPSRLHNLDKENLEVCLSCGEKLKPVSAKSKNNKFKTFCDKCVRVQGLDKSHPCIVCGLVLKSRSLLEAHRKAKHGSAVQVQFDCSKCSLGFSSKQSRTKHENTVHKARPALECEECGECFQSIQTLSFHKSRHTGEFSYSCEHCGKGFNNFKLLEEHEHIHTGRKPYSCTQCTKSFSNRGSLWLHVKKHETNKPYICDYCSKGFGHASHLAVHKRMHTGERPYPCRLCDEGFVSSNHLKRHMKSHKNEDPFACGLCDKTFQKRGLLSKHGNLEHGGKIVDAAQANNSHLHHKPEDTLQLSKLESNVFEHIAADSFRTGSTVADSFRTNSTAQAALTANSRQPVMTSEAADSYRTGSTALMTSHTAVATDRISTAMTSEAAVGRSKEYLLVEQADRMLSLPKLEDDPHFILPENILEEDSSKDQPIVFIQVSGNQQFQPEFMQ